MSDDMMQNLSREATGEPGDRAGVDDVSIPSRRYGRVRVGVAILGVIAILTLQELPAACHGKGDFGKCLTGSTVSVKPILKTKSLCVVCDRESKDTGKDRFADVSDGNPGGPARVIENSIGMQFVRIPAGEFLMGSDESPESLARDYPNYPHERLVKLKDEAPIHAVRIGRPFYLGKFEVTVGQFREFVETAGYVPESEADGTGGYGYNAAYDPATTKRGDAFEGRDPRYSWRNPGFTQTDDHPVVNITWNDATAMAEWLSRVEGKRYRLPTEAEWEYACRAGTKTRYYNGTSAAGLAAIANTFDASAAPYWPKWKDFALPQSDGAVFTAPVGRFAPNAFGVHDMLGNVWEWVADRYSESYYSESPAVDPTGPTTGRRRVRRGGSWHTWSLYARCSFRNWNTPESRYTLVGMRLLLETEPTERVVK